MTERGALISNDGVEYGLRLILWGIGFSLLSLERFLLILCDFILAMRMIRLCRILAKLLDINLSYSTVKYPRLRQRYKAHSCDVFSI